MKDGVSEQPSGFTYIISQVNDSALSPHPLPASRYQELLHGATHKRNRNSLNALLKASLCRWLQAGSPAAMAWAAALSVASHAAGDALAAHTVCRAVPANLLRQQ